MIRNLVTIVARNGVVLGEGPIPRRRRCENGVVAQIVCACSAIIAPSAWNAWLDGYAITHFEIFDVRTNLNDRSRTLMTENDGTLEDEVANTTTLPVVDIGSTDASLSYMYANFMLVA